MANRYSAPNPKAVAAARHFQDVSAAGKSAPAMAPGAKKMLQNYNPPQPHVMHGPHSHSAAADAANLHLHGAPQPTPRSQANRTNIRANVKNDEDHVEITNAPRGNNAKGKTETQRQAVGPNV